MREQIEAAEATERTLADATKERSKLATILAEASAHRDAAEKTHTLAVDALEEALGADSLDPKRTAEARKAAETASREHADTLARVASVTKRLHAAEAAEQKARSAHDTARNACGRELAALQAEEVREAATRLLDLYDTWALTVVNTAGFNNGHATMSMGDDENPRSLYAMFKVRGHQFYPHFDSTKIPSADVVKLARDRK